MKCNSRDSSSIISLNKVGMNNSDIIGSNADKTQNNKNDKSFNSYFFFISYLKGVYVVVEHQPVDVIQ